MHNNIKFCCFIFEKEKQRSTVCWQVESRRVPVNIKKWFDKECNGARISLRKISNQKHRNPNDEEIRKQYHDSLKWYKLLLKSKRQLFENS